MKYFLMLLLVPSTIFGAAFSFSGDWRAEVAMYNRLSLDKNNPGQASADLDPSQVNKTKTYWLQRFKLKPDLIIYDNVRINSEWILLAGSALSSTSLGGAPGNFVAGGVMGMDNVHANLAIRRVWLDWSSDWGVFTMGRQPFNFGLGMTYNSGDAVWDYYGDSVDRIAYKLITGSVSFKLAYDIISEGAVNYYGDDQSAFSTEFLYTEPENNLDMGFLWHMYFAAGQKREHMYDAFQRKVFPVSGITIGWEAAYRKGKMPNLGVIEDVQAFGMLVDFLWKPGSSSFGFKTGFATGDNTPGDGKNYNFKFNRNYKIAFLLFNEDLGIAGDSIHGSQGIGADFNDLGAVFFAPSFNYNFTESLRVGTTIAYALTQRKPNTGRGKSLGTELDIDAAYTWKDNLETGIRMGWFFPSSYFATRATGMGMMATVAVSF